MTVGMCDADSPPAGSLTQRLEQSQRYFFFFFQAEDGIRDYKVTGVQTCALPISFEEGNVDRHSRFRISARAPYVQKSRADSYIVRFSLRIQVLQSCNTKTRSKIGRASCRERV